MKQSEKIAQLEIQVKQQEQILHSLKSLLFGSQSYKYNYKDIESEIIKNKDKERQREGAINKAMDMLLCENKRLWELVRFNAGYKESFNKCDPLSFM